MQRLLKRGKRRTHSSSLYPDGLLVLHSFVHMKNKLLCEDQDESLRERERFHRLLTSACGRSQDRGCFLVFFSKRGASDG